MIARLVARALIHAPADHTWLAAGGTTPVDPTGGLLSYGVLGIIVVCLITGVLVPGYLYKRSEAENDRLRKLIDDKLYPMIEAATSALKESSAASQEIVKATARWEAAEAAPPRRRAT